MVSASAEQRCPRCQALLAPDAAICPNCGLDLSAPASESFSTTLLPPALSTVGNPDEAQPPANSPGADTEGLDMPTYEAPTEAQTSLSDVGTAEVFAPPPAIPMQQGAPPASSARPKVRLGRKAILIALAVLILLGASGGLAYILTRPNPVLTVISPAGGSTLVGSPDMVLRVSGQHFSSNATITFLLDGSPAPGASKTRSDAKGNVQANLTITDDWTFGSHMLTARDDQGYVTKTGVSLKVIPAPVLTINSLYSIGAAAIASEVVPVVINGKRFTPDSSITLFIDGSPLPGSQPITSDAKGRFTLSLTPTGWTLGTHSLTAKDSQGYSTRQAAPLVVVVPGQAGTPGPNGAPADNQTFTIRITVQHQDTLTGEQEDSFQFLLDVMGRPDPAGGLPCATYDNGQPETSTGDLGGGLTYTQTFIFGCSGNYQGGKLKYVEMVVSDRAVLSNGVICNTGNVNLPFQIYEGAFSNSTTISGTYAANTLRVPCASGGYLQYDPETGTWTGDM